MKIRVTLKDPDGFSEAIDEAAKESLPKGLDDDDREDLIENRREKISDALDKWVEYDEYVTIEFDTDKGTATVVERGNP